MCAPIHPPTQSQNHSPLCTQDQKRTRPKASTSEHEEYHQARTQQDTSRDVRRLGPARRPLKFAWEAWKPGGPREDNAIHEEAGQRPEAHTNYAKTRRQDATKPTTGGVTWSGLVRRPQSFICARACSKLHFAHVLTAKIGMQPSVDLRIESNAPHPNGRPRI